MLYVAYLTSGIKDAAFQYCQTKSTGLVQKSEATESWPYFCHILTDLKKFTGRFLGKFAVKWILTIPPHASTVTLPPRPSPDIAIFIIIVVY